MSRRMWVFNSKERMLKQCEHALTLHQLKESEFANIILDKCQRRVMAGLTLDKLFDINFWNSRIGDYMNEPLSLEIPGKSQGDYEVAVVDLSNSRRRDKNTYYVPIRIFSSAA